MKAEAAHAHGHPLTVAAVVGSFSVALGLVVRVSGVMAGAEEGCCGVTRRQAFPSRRRDSRGGRCSFFWRSVMASPCSC
jgi:hypothetical protein